MINKERKLGHLAEKVLEADMEHQLKIKLKLNLWLTAPRGATSVN